VDGGGAGGRMAASHGGQAVIIGLTSGCFDLIHFGHIHYLQRCRALCDRLIVAVDSDKMVRAAKGASRPIIHERDRLQLVNSLGCVDAAFVMGDLGDLSHATLAFGAKRLFKHEGFMRIRSGHIHGAENAELVVVPDVEGLESTTAIIGRILGETP
jgi:D-beta-D-heptose 7-phosphate kinase/D-beta-D-heptose 1-phosphate adenosyltransferase